MSIQVIFQPSQDSQDEGKHSQNKDPFAVSGPERLLCWVFHTCNGTDPNVQPFRQQNVHLNPSYLNLTRIKGVANRAHPAIGMFLRRTNGLNLPKHASGDAIPKLLNSWWCGMGGPLEARTIRK